jgi:hypothetical protein
MSIFDTFKKLLSRKPQEKPRFQKPSPAKRVKNHGPSMTVAMQKKRKRNRVLDKIGKISRKINRGK